MSAPPGMAPAGWARMRRLPAAGQPRRVGKPLGEELAGIPSAGLARDWRILHEIDDTRRTVVLDLRPRAPAYRSR